ncbi:MAG: hypothetical protein ACTSRU_00690 [Candidatus Hodarchaeales archaeon]
MGKVIQIPGPVQILTVADHSQLNLDDGTNPHGTTKADVGLGNVDNTSDLNKPISTATQTALNGKENDLGNPASNGYILSSTIGGVRSWVVPPSASFIDYTSRDTTTISTFSTTGVTHSNFVQAGLDNSKTYIVDCFLIWSHDATSSDAFFEFRNFAVNILSERLQIEPKDSSGAGPGGTNQRIDMFLSGETTPTAGQIQLDLLFGTSNAAQETTIYEVRFSIREKQV